MSSRVGLVITAEGDDEIRDARLALILVDFITWVNDNVEDVRCSLALTPQAFAAELLGEEIADELIRKFEHLAQQEESVDE